MYSLQCDWLRLALLVITREQGQLFQRRGSEEEHPLTLLRTRDGILEQH